MRSSPVQWSAASKGTAVALPLAPPPRVGVDRDPQDPHGPEVNDSGDRIRTATFGTVARFYNTALRRPPQEGETCNRLPCCPSNVLKAANGTRRRDGQSRGTAGRNRREADRRREPGGRGACHPEEGRAEDLRRLAPRRRRLEGASRRGEPGLQRAQNQGRGAGRRQGVGEETRTQPAVGLQEGWVGGAGGANLRVDHVPASGPGSYRVPALPPFAGRRGEVGKALDVRASMDLGYLGNLDLGQLQQYLQG